MESIIVIMTHNFNKETKVFGSFAEATEWANKNGYTLAQTNVPHVYSATF